MAFGTQTQRAHIPSAPLQAPLVLAPLFTHSLASDAARTATPGATIFGHPQPVPGHVPRKAMLWIDTALDAPEHLAAGAPEGMDRAGFGGQGNGLSQLQQWAGVAAGYDALHLVCHGAPARLQLGSYTLDAVALAQPCVRAALRTIGQALRAGAVVHIYACELAAGARGRSFVRALEQALGVPVAAASRMLGATTSGPSWALDSGEGAGSRDTLAWPSYAHKLTIASLNTTFSNIGATTTYVNEPSFYATPKVLSVNNIASSGWDLSAQSSVNTTAFLLRGISAAGLGNGDNTSIRAQANDVDYVTFRSNATSFAFDLGGFYIRNNNAFTITVEALDRNGATTGTAVPFSGAGGGSFFQFDLSANTDFRGIFGFKVNFSSSTDAPFFDSISISNIVTAPAVADGNISLTSTGTGTGGAYKVGDTVTARWDNSATGDNNSGVTGATVDFTQFGGGSTVSATNSGGIWTASYTITAGSIDLTGRNVSVTATNAFGPTTTADTTNATIDNQALTVSAANIAISGGTGTAGAFKIGDIVTATWDNRSSGDNNSDTISSVTFDFTQFGGGAAVAASNSGGIWTANYPIVSGALDTTGRNVTVTATDNAGNPTTRAGTTNAAVDNQGPVVTDANLSISGGTGGTYKAGDAVTATWNNSGTGDNNTDTLSSVTFDFSAFGGGAAVAATSTGSTWSATYTLVAGATSAANRNVSATVTDNAGNATTTADTSNATVDNQAPVVTGVTSSTTDGAYKAEATISIQVAFGENVTVTGTPTLQLNTGTTAVYSSGSGTGSLTFTYTIAAGQNIGDLDYASTGALSLAGGSIRDAAGNNATLTLPALGAVGSLGINKNIAVDTNVPTSTVATITFSDETGSGLTDLVSAEGAQDLSGTLNDIFFVGEKVEVSLNNGGTWTDATAAEGGLTWSLPGQALSGSGSIKVRVTDAAGNHGTEFSRPYTIDTIAPTANTAGGTPADNATSASTTGAIVLPFSEPLDAAGSVLTTVQLRDVATHTVVAATVTINGSGQLVITPAAALSPSVAYSVVWGAGALKDLAGNSVAAVADDTTYNFTTAAAPSSGGGGTPAGQTVDGTTVQTGTTTNSDGSTTTTTTVAPVPANRPEDASTPNSQLADIPLAKVGGDIVLQIGLPVGVGVTSSETTGTNLTLRDKLMGASQPLSSPADFAQLLQAGIDTFVPGVQDPSQVTVRTLTLTSSATSAPGQSITISGANGTGEGDGTHPLRQEALVIDARQMPPGTVLKFDKVEFALVIGAVRIVGGDGANFVVGDGAAQFIVLGAGDDVLRGGAGNDVVGSKGGNDRLYGDEGNDKLVGGIGNDHLEGGAGNDILIGGSSDAGTWRFALGSDGNLHASYASGEPDLSELTQAQITGNWQGGIAIDPRLAMVYNQDYARLETAALLFQGLTGKLPTLDFQNLLSTPEWTKQALLQGAWNWYESTLPANLGTADKAKALITQTLGASMASAQNVGIAVDFLGQGGTWTQALDFLVHLPQVKNAITTQTGGTPLLNLVQASPIAESGWSFDSGNDTLLGGAGNDVLVGGGGSDVLDGDEGTDMAVYFGTLQHYAFTLQTNATSGQQEVLVRHLLSGDVDTLRNVELLQVGGQAYRINAGGLQQGQEYALAGHVAEVEAQEVMLMGVPAF